MLVRRGAGTRGGVQPDSRQPSSTEVRMRLIGRAVAPALTLECQRLMTKSSAFSRRGWRAA